MTLDEALRDAVAYRWAGMPSLKRNRSQGGMAVATLEQIIRKAGTAAPLPSRIAKHVYVGRTVRVDEVQRKDLRRAVRIWQGEGAEAATIIARLNCLSAMGVDVTGTRPTIPRKLKWWLNPEQEATVLAHLADRYGQVWEDLADYIRWASATGLRVEESLELRWSDIHQRGDRTFMTVPGLKTHMAQATLPVSAEAAAILAKRRPLGGTRVFDQSYHQMQRAWAQARLCLGLPNPYVATLKALRRTAARSLHSTKGMPLDMTRQYLRHENVETTMGYLRLTGGYTDEEFAKCL